MPAVRVYIVRHGETEENRMGVMQGHLDTRLNATGVGQATRTALALAPVRFVQAHSSDLSRATQTAEIILEGQPAEGRPVLETHAALRERYMGEMQGKLGSAWRGPLPQDMEPAARLAQRADEWWKGVVVRYAHSVGRSRARPSGGEDAEMPEPAAMLVVSHGGFIRALLQNLIGSRKVVWGEGVQPDQSLATSSSANAAVTVIEVGADGKGTLVLFSDTSHLDAELVEANADIVPDIAENSDGAHSVVVQA